MADDNRPSKSGKSGRHSKQARRVGQGRPDTSRGQGRTFLPLRNLRALVAYYTGLFSSLPGLGLVLAPIAVVFGVLGYRYGRTYPSAEGTGHAAAGIVFAVVGTIVNIVLAVLLAMYMLRLGPFVKK
jgi:hypothetical protein